MLSSVFARKVKCRIDRMWLAGLSRIFHFDPWHAGAPYSCRPYKRTVVELANSLKPEIVVEVGCGLGDILSRVRARERFGLDADERVIRAARFLHPWKIRWSQKDASDIESALPEGWRIDCLIMVNWIHKLSPDDLAAILLPLLPRTGHLILDAIDSDGPESYRFKHDFRFLSGAARRVSSVRAVDEPRSFVVFKVTK